MRKEKLKLHAGTKQDRTFEGPSEKTLILAMTRPPCVAEAAAQLLFNACHLSRFQKAFGISSNFDQYSNLCIISIL